MPNSINLEWSEMLQLMWAQQQNLINKYSQLEGLPSPPVMATTYAGQQILKNFAWRVVEELAEAFHEINDMNEQKMKEELADALHFHIELLIYSGITHRGVDQMFPVRRAISPSPTVQPLWFVAYKLGAAMHELKWKPWRQTQESTDVDTFHKRLVESWDYMMDLWLEFGYDRHDIFNTYMGKAAVNRTRQEEGY